MRTGTLSRELIDVDGITHPGPPPFGHIGELGPIFYDRPGSRRPREIDRLGPIQLRPLDGPRLARPRGGAAEESSRRRWDPEGPVEL
jgi:hypothetical protein